MTRNTTRIAAAALFGCSAAAPALAQTASIVDLGTIGGPTQAAAINSNGVVVGASLGDVESGSRFHGFVWEGVFTGIDSLAGDLDAHAFAVTDDGTTYGMSFTIGRLGARAFVAGSDNIPVLLGDFAAKGANNAGVVVGSKRTLTAEGFETRTACEFRDGTLTTLPGLGGTASTAVSISDTDDIVGWASLPDDSDTHAVLWRNSLAIDLGTLGGSRSQALAQNATGAIAGVSQTASGLMHAFVFQTDSSGHVVTRRDLGVLGGGASTAMGINDAGLAVGTSDDRAFIYEDSQMIDLNTRLPSGSGWVLQGATSINDAGIIVGWGKHHGNPAGFLFNPCAADFNADGAANTLDVLAFLNAWAAGESRADFNNDGDVNTLDVLAFLNAWNAGC